MSAAAHAATQAAAPEAGRLGWRSAALRFPPLRNSLIAGLLLGAGVAIDLAGGPEALAVSMLVAAVPIGAWFFTREGWQELVWERRVGIEVLMLTAAAGCMAFELWEEAAALVFLYSLAEAIEELTFARTRSAIRDVLDLAPRVAHRRLADGSERDVEAVELEVGDVFAVRPGEALPTDGVILSGRATIDEAPVTGESVPAEKGPGDEAFAGTVNGPSAIEVEVTREHADNTLQRIVRLVEEADAGRSRTQRLIDRFARRYSPSVLGAALVVGLLGGLIVGDWGDWGLRGLALVVAGAPCALVISVPIAAAAGMSRAGREGILIKGGQQLEALGGVRAVALDKTGTLTRGAPTVTDVIAGRNGDRDAVLRLAATVEAGSEHPLARAIVEHAREQGLEPTGAEVEAEGFEALTGLGARARVRGREAWAGSPELVRRRWAEAWDEPTASRATALEDEGKTVVAVGTGGRLSGLIALRDEVRPEAAGAIAELRRLGVEHIVMLTGDNERAARVVASELGIDSVEAALSPEGKASRVRELGARFGTVAMVGDGINDAPALAAADVGIALGTGGADAAIEAADVALMADEMTQVGEALRVGRQSVSISRQNLVFSVLVLAALIPGAVAGALSIVVVVLVHEASELIAVANGLRASRPLSPSPA